MAYVTQDRKGDELNRPYEEDLPVHRWYRFVLSYPPHLVRRYVKRFCLREGNCVLDPFCGTGTSLVECKKLGLPSIGVEANPVVAFAARTKTNWDVDPDGLDAYAQQVGAATEDHLEAEGIKDLPLLRNPAPPDLQYRTLDEEQQRLLIKDSISERPLHKVLVLRDAAVETSRASAEPAEAPQVALPQQSLYPLPWVFHIVPFRTVCRSPS